MFPRSAPAAQGMSSRSIGALLDWFEKRAVEGHSIMVVRHGHVVAEGWWTPYSADRPTLRYSVTRSFIAAADSALPAGSTVLVEPADGGWRLHFDSFGSVEVGHGEWRESAPLGRPVVASGAWQSARSSPSSSSSPPRTGYGWWSTPTRQRRRGAPCP